METNNFNINEKRFLLKISIVVGIAQFSTAIMNPFITLYGNQLVGATPQLVGFALGVYGLMQAVFQIPYGYLSDKYGRRSIVIIGLIQMAAGLILSYLSNNIFVFIMARALLGSGAILGVCYSWVGDSFSDEKKNKAMGFAGMVVGAAAAIAFGLGPMLREVISISYMFFLSAMTDIIALFIVVKAMLDKSQKRLEVNIEHQKVQYKKLLSDKSLYKIFFNELLIDYMLFSIYYIIPLMSKEYLKESGMWKVFLPATIVGVISINVTSKFADKIDVKKVMASLFVSTLLGTALFIMPGLVPIIVGMIFFMAGIMGLMVLLPSTINLLTEKTYRGMANGILNTFAFIGTFLGGSITGFIWGNGKVTVVIVLLFVATAGILISLSIKKTKKEYIKKNKEVDGMGA